MTYACYHKVIKGKAPKNASTYVEETAGADAPVGSYICSLCGYMYPGDKKDFDQLPDDYVCPVCGAQKSRFQMKTNVDQR
jgi:rubredoxin